jgi:hypothetical protein
VTLRLRQVLWAWGSAGALLPGVDYAAELLFYDVLDCLGL